MGATGASVTAQAMVLSSAVGIVLLALLVV